MGKGYIQPWEPVVPAAQGIDRMRDRTPARPHARHRAADKCQLRARAGPRNPSITGFIWEYHILSLGRDNRTR